MRTIVVALAGALALSSLTACGGGQGTTNTPTGGSSNETSGSTGSGESSSASSSKGSAPDFTLPSLDGKNISLSDYKGKVVLIDFWSTTCDPCLVEMPHLVSMYEKLKSKGFVILAVSLDGPETRSQVSTVVHDKKMSFPVLLDEETSVVARYNPKRDMPFSVLVDKNGNIVKKTSGYSPGDEEKLAAEVEKLLQ